MRPWLLLALMGGPLALIGCGDEFTGTTGGGGAGATGGTAGTGGTGGDTGDENCTNGIDDDDNGLADCDDPQCQPQFACVPPAPQEWGEVGWLTVQTDGACAAMFSKTLDLYDQGDLHAPPISDCGCSCEDAPTECVSTLECFNSGDCIVGALETIEASEDCSDHDLASVQFYASCTASHPIPDAESCAADADPTKELDWPAAWRACLTDQGGHCESGDWCVRRPSGDDAVGPCVAKTGDHDCPGEFSDKTLYQQGEEHLDDTRSCDGCTCGPPTGGSCSCSSCSVDLHTGSGCSGVASEQVAANGVCNGDVPIQAGITSIDLAGAEVTTPASCTAAGGTPTGEVTYTGQPITVCCVPR